MKGIWAMARVPHRMEKSLVIGKPSRSKRVVALVIFGETDGGDALDEGSAS